jgi:hypothetical protein
MQEMHVIRQADDDRALLAGRGPTPDSEGSPNHQVRDCRAIVLQSVLRPERTLKWKLKARRAGVASESQAPYRKKYIHEIRAEYLQRLFKPLDSLFERTIEAFLVRINSQVRP